MRRGNSKGPQFVRFFGPLLDALQQLGGSGRPDEVKDKIAETLKIPDEKLQETVSSGQGRISNQIDWARFYLSKAGYLESPARGVWALSDRGRQSRLSQDDALRLFKEVHRTLVDKDAPVPEAPATEQVEEEQEQPPDESSHRGRLLELLKRLPPKGFEELCQEVLRRAGFSKVEVTGRSGDGGIDGEGILQVNPLVSFKVLFQCKRYTKAVGPDFVRDFRGAMEGRADKGIILTTGTFTRGAEQEAVRAGAKPIELVDAERLLDLIESLQFGLRPRTVFDIDDQFYSKFFAPPIP